jgi:hypothetical protein
MTTDVLEKARATRERTEQEERQQTVDGIRDRLVPFILSDLAGTMSDDDAATLIEVLDDLELSDDDYRAMKSAAVTLGQDLGQLHARIPMLESEKTRYARFAVARRRSERILEQANAAMKMATSLQMQVSEYRKAVEQHAVSHPYLFTDGEPMAELVDLFPPAEKATAQATKKCLICEIDHTGDRGDFCTEKCEHLAAQHGDALQQLGILPKAKGKK